MGAGFNVPQSVVSMPTDTTKQFNVIIEYCGAWGYSNQANFANGVIKNKYPLAAVQVYSPGKTSNIIVKINNVVVWEKKKGDGPINESTIEALMLKIKSVVEAKWAQKTKQWVDIELQWVWTAKARAVVCMTIW